MSDLNVALFGAAAGLFLGIVSALAAYVGLKPAIARAASASDAAKGRRTLFFATAVMPALFAAAGAAIALRLVFGRSWWVW